MRVAISGAHGTGKTSLVEALANRLPGYSVFEEPFYQLEGEGHIFSGMPNLRDFELQLDRSIKSIVSSGSKSIFDRCPADYLAYLLSHKNADRFELELWLPQIRMAMAHLTHVIYVPIENPDRIWIPKSEGHKIRARVDERLHEILIENRFAFSCRSTQVSGSLEERVEMTLEKIEVKDF